MERKIISFSTRLICWWTIVFNLIIFIYAFTFLLNERVLLFIPILIVSLMSIIGNILIQYDINWARLLSIYSSLIAILIFLICFLNLVLNNSLGSKSGNEIIFGVILIGYCPALLFLLDSKQHD